MIRKLLKFVAYLIAIVIVVVLISGAIAFASIEFGCRPEGAVATKPAASPVDDPGYKRTEANTYLTFPEWYIVYSFEDFGRFLETKPESQFPYLSQISGFWRSFCAANEIASGLPGDHGQYKLMIYVIGLSYTFEFLIKGAYENTIGRVTEWERGGTPTDEDDYARAVIQDYAAFLYQIPWYRYPFTDKLRGLWQETDFLGAAPLRGLERKLSLSGEYLVKAGYARLIALGLAATTTPADLEIMFIVEGDPGTLLASEPKVRLVRILPDGNGLLVAPRYQEFTELLRRMSDRGIGVVEIAGNRHILMSAIVPEDSRPNIDGLDEMFALPVDARPGYLRIGYNVEVGDLSRILVAAKGAGVEVEHFYDY
jgi:hypothetical protein